MNTLHEASTANKRKAPGSTVHHIPGDPKAFHTGSKEKIEAWKGWLLDRLTEPIFRLDLTPAMHISLPRLQRAVVDLVRFSERATQAGSQFVAAFHFNSEDGHLHAHMAVSGVPEWQPRWWLLGMAKITKLEKGTIGADKSLRYVAKKLAAGNPFMMSLGSNSLH